MKKGMRRLLALVLVLLMLTATLTGCTVDVPPRLQQLLAGYVPVDFEDMEYTRPDLEAIQTALDECMESANQPDFLVLELDLLKYMLLYQDFYTNYFLADIHYCADVTDPYWTEEYNWCLEATTEVDAGIDQLFYVLADSPHREALETDEYYGEGFFDDYEGESIWDDHFTALMDREAELLSEYYDLSAQGMEADYNTYYNVIAPQLCQVYIDLVLVRQEIAVYAGYSSYPEYAYAEHYTRDYTPAQETEYLAMVRQELVPIYRDLFTNGVSGVRIRNRSEEDTYAYVEEMANAMGGPILESFEFMTEHNLYDITISDNKYGSSFEVFLYGYGQPYLFVCPTGSDYDYLTFTHEFGHFCNDYLSDGSGVSIDVAEIFSQGMEYLSLFYVEDTESLEILQMVMSISTFVEQSAYADFEQRVYAMDPADLTVENVFALFEQVGNEYGFDCWGFDARDFVSIPHFFTNPCYVFSYVVSNDAALQFYQIEKAEPGAGLALIEEHLDTEEEYFLAFLESAGLTSPFAEGRIQSVAATFKEIFQ